MVIIGGYAGPSSIIEDHVDVYSIIDGKVTWSYKAKDCPHIVEDASVTVTGDKIWMVGGDRKTGRESSVYDFTLNDWTSLPAMHDIRTLRPAVFVLEGRLYAAGGQGSLDRIESLDISNYATGVCKKL